jgi:DNA-binding CsgD family transcriptional regulator
LLDTIREFGAERLDESGDAGGTRRRFVARYLAMASHFRDHFLDDDQLARMSELRREHANVRAALEYAFGGEEDKKDAHQADGVDLAIALSVYWRARGLAREGSYWLGRAAERAREGSAERGHAVLERGHLLAMQGDAAGALATASQAIALAARLGDKALAARGYLLKTAALSGKGRLAAAAESGEEARRRLTALDDQLGLAGLDIQLTYLALLNDDIEAALGHVEHGLRQLSGSRERWLHANLYMLASLSLYLAGRDIESTWTAIRALQVKHEIGDLLGIAASLELLGWLAARAGSHQRAAWLLGAADPLWERAGGRLAASASFERLHAEAVARCGGALGGKLFAELFARGLRHPVEAMIAFALNDVGDPAAGGDTKIRLPSQLTAREREIASLVAAGLSNRQIAEMLYISRRTVDAHLEHIFGKLGITSRVMLTIQLREHSAATDTGANA